MIEFDSRILDILDSLADIILPAKFIREVFRAGSDRMREMRRPINNVRGPDLPLQSPTALRDRPIRGR